MTDRVNGLHTCVCSNASKVWPPSTSAGSWDNNVLDLIRYKLNKIVRFRHNVMFDQRNNFLESFARDLRQNITVI